MTLYPIITWKLVKGSTSADTDQVPHNVASDQRLYCLLTGFSIKTRIKARNRPDTPKLTNGLLQHITVEESTSIQGVMNAKKRRANSVDADEVVHLEPPHLNLHCLQI